jgi:hypothetical protein
MIMPGFQKFSEAVGWVAEWAKERLPEIVASVSAKAESAEENADRAAAAQITAAEMADAAALSAESAVSAENTILELISQYLANPQDISDADEHLAGECYADGWDNLPEQRGFIRTVNASAIGKRYQSFVSDSGELFLRTAAAGEWSVWKQGMQL